MLVWLQVKASVALIADVSDMVVKQLQLPLGAAAVITNGRTVWDHNPAAGNVTAPGGLIV